MGRWEPGTRGRLAQNALELFAERGFEATTAAEIAERAGVTERTFFRHFTDKRDALFHGGELLQTHLTDVVARSEGSALELVRAALDSAAAAVETNPERARTRDAVIATHPELRERELTKMDGLVRALRSALGARGVPDATALLAAETGVAVFKVGFARWLARPGSDLPTVLAAAFDDLADLLGTPQS